tara:strand:+ start:1899 stop:2600 length:702 start_codon:yes stop_codon:yes gene_type:complete
MGTMNTIQERMRQKAFTALDIVEFEIDKLMDKKTSSFSMLKYLKQLGYSGRVVAYMKGCTETTQYELKNEEKCEQLEEAYSFLTPKQKEKVIKKLQQIEDDIVQFCNEYKPVRKVRIKTPAQLVKKLPYKQKFTKYESINPEEIIRARMLFVYNTTSKKLTKFEGQGLSVRGSRITGYDVCEEKTLTDLSLLDRLVSGGNIIAQKFMDEIPRSKLKEGNDRITKNIILVKVVK